MEKQDEKTESIWQSWPFRIGVVLTLLVFLITYVFLFWLPVCAGQGPCRTNWQFILHDASPNEIGDTLAGLAGSLAFVWIIVTVLLQKEELNAQRKELKLHRKESEKMAASLDAQVEIFRHEKIVREQELAKRELDEILKNLIEAIFEDGKEQPSWNIQTNGRGLIVSESMIQLLPHQVRSIDSIDEAICNARDVVIQSVKDLFQHFEHNRISKFPKRQLLMYESIRLSEFSLQVLSTRLSEADRLRLGRLQVNKLVSSLEAVVNHESLWDAG